MMSSEATALSGDEEFDRIQAETKRLDQEMTASTGWPIILARNSLDDSVRIFRGNDHELQEALGIGRDPAQWIHIMSMDNQDGLGALIDKLDRLLHNYLASAYSLSCCMYKMMRGSWTGKPQEQQYRSRTPFSLPGLPAFMFGLRHAAQHERIPMTSSGVSGWRNESTGQLVAEAYFFLVLEDLKALNWKKEPLAFAHLNSLTEPLRLDLATTEFTTTLLSFAAWFRDAYLRFHKAQLQELELLVLKRNEVVKPVLNAWAGDQAV